MRIAICDDEPACRQDEEISIKVTMEKYGLEYECVSFESAEELLAYDGEIDILLLDIEMKGMNGIEAMNHLVNSENVHHIYFVSAYSDYVFKAFGKKTRGFVCKPIDIRVLYREFSKVLSDYIGVKAINIKYNDKDVILTNKDIIYVKSEDKYVDIVTKKGNYVLCASLKEWEDILSECGFLRSHRSYIVNPEYVDTIKDCITLSVSEEKIPIGRKYKQDFKNNYNEYRLKRFRENSFD